MATVLVIAGATVVAGWHLHGRRLVRPEPVHGVAVMRV